MSSYGQIIVRVCLLEGVIARSYLL